MDNEITVQVKQGKLRGGLYQTIYDTFYIAFLAVPYAAPPIGNLRFMDPHPPDSWVGVRDCRTRKDNCCIQKVIWPRPEIIGSEDCLYLNIYVPFRIRKTTEIAVMVWIHGGHYMNGSGNFYNAQPDYLIEKDIILVTVNYRLGAFGFLNLDHKVANGNQGLKDQIAALIWIKENIVVFGGDPNNITLFGCNAGSICVHLLMLSTLSKDLFHKAILQSGVATMNWATQDNTTIERSYRLASVLGVNSSDPYDIIAFLKRASDIDIISAQYDMLTPEERESRYIFGPSVDRFSERPFFSFFPDELFHMSNQKPVMLGYTSLEFIRFLNERTQEKLQRLYKAIPSYTRMFLPLSAPQEQIEQLGMNFQKFYFNDIPPTLSSLLIVLQCYNDIFFDIPIKTVADFRRYLTNVPTYVYEFSYVGNQKIVDINLYWYNVHLPVSTQNDDVAYLFFLPEYKDVDSIIPSPGTDDFKMVQIMTNMWTNFAQIGDPTPFTNKYIPIKWKPATRENFYYLHIDEELQLFTVTDYHLPFRPLM